MATNLGRLLRRRRLYTGESANTAQREVARRLDGGPIPDAAHPDQVSLESLLLQALAWPNETPRYPCGIRAVHPTPDHLVITVENTTKLLHDLVARTLPVGNHRGISGIPGLRHRRSPGGAVTLFLAGTAAAVTLRGVSWSQWSATAQVLADTEQFDDAPPLWTGAQGTLTDAESDHLGWYRDLDGPDCPLWLPSGVLRRIAIFQTTDSPRWVTGWRAGDAVLEHWVFEASYRGHSAPHDQVIDLLTDQRFGLPLVLERRDCRCPHDDPSTRCMIYFSSPLSTAARLELRFGCRPSERPAYP
ncbi:hypothetical protein [Kitasatospora nipponensis]|uniref:hypothetical protein n=1 Tax=Kitasatospora nipponensis TaxID=258049 RepID=UPI0031DB45E3